jgi:beta-glucosidase
MDLNAIGLGDKVRLTLGSDMWHTAAVESAGIEQVALSDGPHGLRKAAPDDFFSSEPATCFPTASALACSWDPGLAMAIGVALGEEARAQDVAVVLGPGINVKRHPLCGRNFEYFSEDPHLAGRLAAAMVEGIQSQHVGACVKHFAANNQETDRMRVSADVDERTLREIYLPAFETAVTRARPWTVMCAYNKLNGVYAAQHRWLLTELLRREWGFDGMVVSDWGAVHDRVAALEAGLDLEMPPNFGISDTAVLAAIEKGELSEKVLEAAVANVIRLVERARGRQPGTLDADGHHALARRAAAASMVLLKNSGPVLPLVDGPGLKVAVTGEFATEPRFQGGGSSRVNATEVDIPLDELRTALPSARFVDDPAEADVIVAFVGLEEGQDTEGKDRDTMDLPAGQVAELRRLAGTGRPVVAVVCAGSVVSTAAWDDAASAIVMCGLAGQGSGGALAEVLTGAANPSGKLAETIPLRLEDCPAYLNFPGEEGHVRYGEGVFVGYRGYDAVGTQVAYPFGHGLSYTTFSYDDLQVSGREISCTVTNTGDREGAEVVQLYVGDPHARVARPPRELKGFSKVSLAPGASRRVTFTLTDRDLSYWSVAFGGWLLEPGEFRIEIGASSRDIRLATTIHIEGEPPRLPLTLMSTLSEWLDDPVGRERLRAVTGNDYEFLNEFLGSSPISVLPAFSMLGITPDMLKALL